MRTQFLNRMREPSLTYFDCIWILLTLQLGLCSGRRGPCTVKRIPHDIDITGDLYMLWPEDEDDFTERDIIRRAKGAPTSDPQVVEKDDILSCATSEEASDLGLRWPNATVPFVFHNMMSYHGRLQVLTAMNEYHRHTCIQFKKRKKEPDYLVIGSSYQMICASGVGRQGGAQLLHLGPACTRSLGTPMHELMHALGFFHEHMRPDRNNYVFINYSNIDQALWKNFREMHPVSLLRELDAGYDFGSLMHYRLCAMTNNSWPTIVPKNLDPAAASEVNLENKFTAVAKGGDAKGDGRTISQQAVEQWLQKAQVIDDKTVFKGDVTAAIQKTGKTTLSFAEFSKMLADLAASKKVDLAFVKQKLLRV